ncbi:NAD-dependent protein deacetylase 2 [Egicoccus halophilus]|uniref:protein acetyllysine N-acetyltransferase n=1 Tax=Egicoccus halophilus TaxID=1670830 RepID=A0A8J3A646_9ACTN|nr:NAD-dependent protein deacetylase 2 [Egicoccus halophilus]
MLAGVASLLTDHPAGVGGIAVHPLPLASPDDAVPRGTFVLVDEVATWLRDADRVVVLTGAGMSTASGIPDYRGPQGVWTRDPAAERRSSIDVWLTEPDTRRDIWRERLAGAGLRPRPNAAHVALAELERLGRLDTLVTQNTDGLHQDAGNDPDRVVEIHGTNRFVHCLDCGDRHPMPAVLERVADGDDDPHCTRCGGLLKAATVSFGQPLDPARLQRAHDAAVGCEVFLALGTSLAVHPVALLPRTALEAGARLVVANAEPTPYDRVADAVLADDLVEVVPALVERVRATSAG